MIEPTPPAGKLGPPRRGVALVSLVLFLAVVAVFLPAVRCGFVNFDDPHNVYDCPEVMRGLSWDGIRWAFTHPIVGHWHPLTTISHMAVCHFFGVNAWAHHFANVLLHAAAAVLLFAALREMTGSLWRSALVAALFAVHPARVESVLWIAERKDVLSGVFFMLTIWAHVRFAKRPTVPRYLAITLFLALGLMSKSMLVTLPCVLLLLDGWPLRRFGWRAVLEKLPLLCISGAAALMQLHVSTGAVQDFPLRLRIGNALVGYVDYLRQWLWPTKLAVLYPYPLEIPLRSEVLAVVLLVAITVATLVPLRRCPWLFTGWAWYVGTLFPVCGLIQTGAQAMADRYSYLPLIGPTFAIVWTLADLAAARRWHPRILTVSAAAALAIFTAITLRQIPVWHDSATLFRHAIAVTRENPIAHMNLGMALFEDGQKADGIGEVRTATRLAPSYGEARLNLGTMLEKTGDLPGAYAELGEAFRLLPRSADAALALALVLTKAGQPARALPLCEQALRLKPAFAEAHNDLGLALDRLGRDSEAAVQFADALKLRPPYADAHYNFGNLLYKTSDYPAADRHFSEALRLRPAWADAHNGRAGVLFMLGKADQAIAEYREALRIQPGHPEAGKNLEAVLRIRNSAP